jgi:hypothetical protein
MGANFRVKWSGTPDEVEAFRPLTMKAAEEATKIPGTSSLSLWKLKQDRDWLERLDPTKATPEDVKRMERLSIRMQCLLSDMPGVSCCKRADAYPEAFKATELAREMCLKNAPWPKQRSMLLFSAL